MIDHSPLRYFFIRTSISLLHYFAPLLIVCLVLTLIIDHNAHRLTLILEILSIAEVIFYVLVYIPKYRLFQKPAKHPPIAPQEERRSLFQKSCDNITDPEAYLSKWFLNAPLSAIHRDNVKEFFCWAFFNRGAWGPEDEQELEEYVDRIEELIGAKLKPGRGRVKAMRPTLDPVKALHRPLLWYTIIALVDAITYVRLRLHGFQHYRLPFSRFLTVFPPRIITLASWRTSSSPPLSYWHKPHTSKTRKPIVFVHGIGIGLWPYVNFMIEVNKPHRDSSDGQIGIIAIELMPICSRITGEIQDQESICRGIMKTIGEHGWDRFELVTHSFGSVIATNLLKMQDAASRISSIALVDPASILLHLPDVAYNFTRRPPRKANEYQLYYFASTDICVANTIARHFFWAENILWKEALRNRKVTVVLCGRDLIVNTHAVGRYLAEDEPAYERFLAEDEGATVETDMWKDHSWKGEGLDIVWFENLDHAQVFEKARNYRRLVDIVRSYSADT
ncbi:MAG: hypothetical protein LQ340_002677 [Diploschistes diacapsis]|nr:MAG: hypothetical protein LQ340_002677 [Diploschistes diacapsis]